MIVLLIGGLYAHTGTMPPLVVVESSSMIHSEQGEIGSIDAGDLILVQETSFENIVTFAEATDVRNRNYGYETHGMEGDVIIFKKGGSDVSTPIIHRAILRVVANETSVPDRDAFSSPEVAMTLLVLTVEYLMSEHMHKTECSELAFSHGMFQEHTS